MHSTFNVVDLRPFAGNLTDDEDPMDLRTNPFQGEGDHDLGPSPTTSYESKGNHHDEVTSRKPCNQGPITRGMLRKLQENL